MTVSAPGPGPGPKRNYPESFILDSNRGGVPITVCVCGVLTIYGSNTHIDNCPHMEEL
jgi:hypothetical protein